MGKRTERTVRVLENTVKPKAEVVKKSVCAPTFLVLAVKSVGLILFYYIFSIGLTFYNQRFIKHFKYPLSLTVCHLLVKFFLSAMIRMCLECRSQEPRIMLSWGMYFKRLAPTGVASALDIGLSNWSFEFITVSLYTMSKSTAVIFILGFSLLFKLEKMRCSLLFVVMFIAAGLFMFTYHSTQFNLEGFIMVMSAAVLSGVRWTLAQIVLQKQEIGLHNPLDMMYHIQPWMIVGILPLSAIFEGIPLATTINFFRFEEYGLLLTNMGLVLAGALLAFFLEFSEFLLLSNTSSLTLSISGIFKEICVLYLAAKVNGDKMNVINGIGLVVCLIGITLHVILKAVYGREASESVRHLDDSLEMLIKNGQANADDDTDEEQDVFNVRTDR